MNTKPIPFIDWEQVRLNGGPPCFHVAPYVPDHPKFCGRAERWVGHQADLDHAFVPLDELLAAAEKRAEEAVQARDETVAAWASAADDRDTYSSKLTAAEDCARELELKGLQLVNYLGPLMLAAQAVVSGRDGGIDDLRRMLDVRYDPTKGEALSLASQLAAANAEIERLRGGLNSAAKEIDRILRLGREEACDWSDLALGFDDVRDGLITLAASGPAAHEVTKETK